MERTLSGITWTVHIPDWAVLATLCYLVIGSAMSLVVQSSRADRILVTLFWPFVLLATIGLCIWQLLLLLNRRWR